MKNSRMKKSRSIITKKSGRGYTHVLFGNKLSKDNLRFEVVGTIDELSSFLGMAKSLVKDKKGKSILEEVQNNLFIVGNQISGSGLIKVKQNVIFQHIIFLENEIKKLEKKFVFKSFILPGDNLVSSALHICRTVARRLERRAVALRNKRGLKDKDILVYLDKLSNLLFLLACRYNSKNFRR